VKATVRVFLAGEGSNELGVYARDAAYRDEDGCQGVLCALLAKVQPGGWRVGGSKLWKDIRKLQAKGALKGKYEHEDTRNVLKLALTAEEAGHHVLVFSRDADADEERAAAIEEGLRRAAETYPGVKIIGGIAIPALEGWVLALLEVAKTESFSRGKAEAALIAEGFEPKDGVAMVAIVEQADLAKLPSDAKSLVHWLKRAREVLPAAVARLGATP
jgi:hypothetical protein